MQQDRDLTFYRISTEGLGSIDLSSYIQPDDGLSYSRNMQLDLYLVNISRVRRIYGWLIASVHEIPICLTT
jgi:hypothetical protein